MKQKSSNRLRFFLSKPEPCAYLKGMTERKLFTMLSGVGANDLHHFLSQQGFRRSQFIAYRPNCEFCSACIPVRVCVNQFRPSKNRMRFTAERQSIQVSQVPLHATSEQYELFSCYLKGRHGNSSMKEMGFEAYRNVVEDSHVTSFLNEYRDTEGSLLAVALIDRLHDGLSMVYSFFDPEKSRLSLGTMAILDQINRSRESALPYLYLGYWVEGSSNMDYKKYFTPQERLINGKWQASGEYSSTP